jgi:hypothetical protein
VLEEAARGILTLTAGESRPQQHGGEHPTSGRGAAWCRPGTACGETQPAWGRPPTPSTNMPA